MDKKGSIQIVAVILALVILGYFLISVAQRECNSNRDCSDNAYCNTNYECHGYPEQIVVKESNWIPAALILGIFLLVSAYILRTKKIPFLNEKN
jgi:hypothetical protein